MRIRATGPIFLASNLCTLVFFWLGSIFVSSPQPDSIALRLPHWDEMKWWLGRPDTGYYIDIAEHGYKAAPFSADTGANWAFFPAYPLLLRLIAHGRSAEFYLAAGWCLSVVFFAVGVWYLGRLLMLDTDEETATRALLLFCFYPFVYSLAVFGPDSLLLCTVCAAFYYARRGNWLIAAVAAAIACVSRIQGVLVVPCLLYMVRRERWALLTAAAAPVGLFAFGWELWRLTGNPLAFIGIQKAWNNSPSYPFAFLVDFVRHPMLIGASGWDPELLSVAVTCAMGGLLVWAWMRKAIRPEYLLFFALQMVVLTCRTSTLGNLRYVTGCFPAFPALAIMTKRPVAFALLLAVFAGFLGLFAALFAAGQQHHPGFHFAAF